MIYGIKLENDVTGEQLDLHLTDSSNYVLGTIDWGAIESDHHTFKFVNQVGVYLVATSLETRQVNIVGWVVGESEEMIAHYKDFLNRFVNPQQQLNLYYDKYVLHFFPDTSVKYPITIRENNEYMCKFGIVGLCADPMFEDSAFNLVVAANWVPMFHFPLIIPGQDYSLSDNIEGTIGPVSQIDVPTDQVGQNIQVECKLVASQVVSTAGKNKWAPYKGPSLVNGITMTVAEDGGITLNGTAGSGGASFNQQLPTQPSGMYALNANNSVANASVALRIKDSSNGDLWMFPLGSANFATGISIAGDIGYGNIEVSAGAILSNFKLKPMLEEGYVLSPYEPFAPEMPSMLVPSPITKFGTGKVTQSGESTTNEYNFTFPQEIGGIPDWPDIFTNTGSAKTRALKRVLDGTENIGLQSINNAGIADFIVSWLPGTTVGKAICTHYKYEKAEYGGIATRTGFYIAPENNLYIRISQADLPVQTVDAFKAYLTAQNMAGTPVTIWYGVTDETDFTIDPVTIPALGGLNSLSCDVAYEIGSFIDIEDIEVDEGIIFGYKRPDLIMVVNNSGAVPVGMGIDFIASGTVVGPALINMQTQDKFRIDKTLQGGEHVTINTTIGNKSVMGAIGNDELSNYFKYRDFDSVWLQIPVGTSTFTYTADDGMVDDLEVHIHFNNKYLEVQK